MVTESKNILTLTLTPHPPPPLSKHVNLCDFSHWRKWWWLKYNLWANIIFIVSLQVLCVKCVCDELYWTVCFIPVHVFGNSLYKITCWDSNKQCLNYWRKCILSLGSACILAQTFGHKNTLETNYSTYLYLEEASEDNKGLLWTHELSTSGTEIYTRPLF